jgi:hypothetical protein
MSEMMIEVMPKRSFDFATVAVGGSQDVILADRVELLEWRELTMIVRVHSHTLTGSNTISVYAFPQSWTSEDPASLFWDPAFVNGVVITSTTPSPALLEVNLPTVGNYASKAILAMARFVSRVNKVGAGTVRCSLTISVKAKNA